MEVDIVFLLEEISVGSGKLVGRFRADSFELV